LAAVLHQSFEVHHDGITGKTATRQREVSRCRAITLTETANPVGAEPAGMGPRMGDEPFELRPRRGSLGNELV
jgi:hypothetical protein